MFRLNNRKFALALLTSVLISAMVVLPPATHTNAADHGDAPGASLDRAADLADIYAFLDPNDNSRVVLIMTIGGFIVPGEAANFGIFDPALRYRFLIENTGDSSPDRFIDVRFSRRVANDGVSASAQMATITLPDNRTFNAPVTNPSAVAATAPTRTITTDAPSGVQAFMGLADDPFFFDIPAFLRFTASARAGTPDPSVLQRGRDTFDGYSITAIALSLPATLLRGSAGNEIGIAIATQRRAHEIFNARDNQISSFGRFVNIDRMGQPGINVALIPFNLKNEHNAGNTTDDAAGRYVPAMMNTLRVLGTNEQNINLLMNLSATRGDFLRLNLAQANSGTGGGNNASAAYPNGRRLRDDVIDTFLTVVTNGAVTSDNVNSVDPFTNSFPFLAPPIQPFAPGTTDDRTRN